MPGTSRRAGLRAAKSALVVATMAVALTGAGLLWAGPARAHTDLVASSPASGARLDAPPATLDLAFTDPMSPGLSDVTVSIDGATPSAVPVTQGNSTSTLRATFPPAPEAVQRAASGWTVGYRVVSRDGHAVVGRVRFTVRSPRPQEPRTSGSGPASDEPIPARPASSEGPSSSSTEPSPTRAAEAGGGPGWWIGGVTVVLLAGGLTVAGIRRLHTGER